jgi:hypothetical protein
VMPTAGFLFSLLDEIGGQQLLEQGQNPDCVAIDDRRERECVACLKSAYPKSKTNQAQFVLELDFSNCASKTIWH